MKRLAALAWLAAFSLISGLGRPRTAFAEENPGVSAAPILQLPIGSRALGMGTAFTAVASDVSALFYNPAGLSRLSAHEVSGTYMTGLVDDSIQHYAYGGPIPFTGLSGNGYSSLGASALWSRSGRIEVNRTNADGSFLDARNISAGSDFVANLAYAERVGSTPLDIREKTFGINHFVGIGGKYIYSTLVEQYRAHAFTGDIGYLVLSPEAGLAVGVAVQNVGGQLKYEDEADPLPTTIRTGLAYQGGVTAAQTLTLAADGEYVLTDRIVRAQMGLEYFMFKMYGARVGYQFLRDSLGLTAGFGFRWRSRILIDYAWAMSSGLNDTHRFTFTYRFGGVAPARRARQRRPFIDADTLPDRDRIRETIDDRQPREEPVRRPRPVPREERPAGVPGWIY